MRRHARDLAEGMEDPAFVKIGKKVFSCSIKDMSVEGAGLRLDKAMELPDRFELRFGRTSRNCSLVWQENGNAGVLFEANTGHSEHKAIAPNRLTPGGVACKS